MELFFNHDKVLFAAIIESYPVKLSFLFNDLFHQSEYSSSFFRRLSYSFIWRFDSCSESTLDFWRSLSRDASYCLSLTALSIFFLCNLSCSFMYSLVALVSADCFALTAFKASDSLGAKVFAYLLLSFSAFSLFFSSCLNYSL